MRCQRKCLTQKRRTESRFRRWGTGSGRRLPSAGPSSPVRRSRTCFYPVASPIFAPFSLSSPRTCCPVFGSVLRINQSLQTVKPVPQSDDGCFLTNTARSSVTESFGKKLTQFSHIFPWTFCRFKVSQSHNHCFLIHNFLSFTAACHSHSEAPTLFEQSQSAHRPLNVAIGRNSPECVRRMFPDRG